MPISSFGSSSLVIIWHPCSRVTLQCRSADRVLSIHAFISCIWVSHCRSIVMYSPRYRKDSDGPSGSIIMSVPGHRIPSVTMDPSALKPPTWLFPILALIMKPCLWKKAATTSLSFSIFPLESANTHASSQYPLLAVVAVRDTSSPLSSGYPPIARQFRCSSSIRITNSRGARGHPCLIEP